MEKNKRAIGVFDSGIGGVTVLKKIKEELPHEKIVYFGDTKRLPYGTKNKGCIIKNSRQIVRFLMSKNVKAIVIACNSISAVSLDILRKEFDIPFIEVIEPASYDAVLATRNKKVGIIATETTVKSGIYKKKIKIIDQEIEVYSKACTLFVPLVEEGLVDSKIAESVAKTYLQGILGKKVDTLVLGCTHYPLLYKHIRGAVGLDISIIDPSNATSKVAKEQLLKRNLLSSDISNKNTCDFYVSGDTQKFNELCDKLMGYKCKSIYIDIESY